MPSGALTMTGWLKPRARRSVFGALGLGAVADADDLELLGEAVGDADDHVVDQRAGEAVQRAVLPLVVGPLDHERAARRWRTVMAPGMRPGERALRALHRDGARPSMVTSTPPGTVMGDLPMRDIECSDSPHVAEDFAAHFALARLAVGHQPLAGGQDGHAETAEDARHRCRPCGRPAGRAWRRGAGREIVRSRSGEYFIVIVSTSPGPVVDGADAEAVDVALLAGGSSASATFCLDDGMRTSSCIAVLALRMRVSMSAMGSVIIGVAPSPARLGHAGDLAGVGQLAQADAAQAELAVHRTRPAAAAAAGVAAHLVLRLGLALLISAFLAIFDRPSLSLLLRRAGRRGALAADRCAASALDLLGAVVGLPLEREAEGVEQRLALPRWSWPW